MPLERESCCQSLCSFISLLEPGLCCQSLCSVISLLEPGFCCQSLYSHISSLGASFQLAFSYTCSWGLDSVVSVCSFFFLLFFKFYLCFIVLFILCLYCCQILRSFISALVTWIMLSELAFFYICSWESGSCCQSLRSLVLSVCIYCRQSLFYLCICVVVKAILAKWEKCLKK